MKASKELPQYLKNKAWPAEEDWGKGKKKKKSPALDKLCKLQMEIR